MGSFTFITYSGEDAGRVLVKMLDEGVPTADDDEVHEVETETKIAMGFQPNPPSEDEDEDGEEDDPSEDPY